MCQSPVPISPGLIGYLGVAWFTSQELALGAVELMINNHQLISYRSYGKDCTSRTLPTDVRTETVGLFVDNALSYADETQVFTLPRMAILVWYEAGCLIYISCSNTYIGLCQSRDLQMEKFGTHAIRCISDSGDSKSSWKICQHKSVSWI
jgi:hypothetical protein